MGGIQATPASVAEVHAVRGGQLILRVAPSQTTAHIMEAKREAKKRSSRRGKIGSGFASLGGSFEGEGNDRIMTREGSMSSLAKFGEKSGRYNGRSYLLEQSMDVLEKVFFRLSPRDLALLCLTSKAVNQRVREFIDHHSSSHGLPVKFHSFYALNENLLLPKEEVLKERIEVNPKPQLLLYSTMNYFVGRTIRVSILNIDEKFITCNNTGTPCVIKERDVSLKRDVVVVKEQRYSCCRPKFTHMFKEVSKGVYVIQMRLRLTGEAIGDNSFLYRNPNHIHPHLAQNNQANQNPLHVLNVRNQNQRNRRPSITTGFICVSRYVRVPRHGFHPLSRQATVNEFSSTAIDNLEELKIKLNKNDVRSRPGSCKQSRTKENLVVQPIDSNWWPRIHTHQMQHLESQFSSIKAIYDADSDWFFLRTDLIKIDRKCDVELSFEDFDTSNNNFEENGYRQGVVWDFIEMKQIVKLREM